MIAQNELMSRELRDSLSKRTDVLEKVKHLLLLPGIEMMTSKQVAEYFEVTTDMLKQVYVYNRAEIDNDGVMMMKPCDFDKLADDGFRGNNELPLKNDENHPVYVRIKTGKREAHRSCLKMVRSLKSRTPASAASRPAPFFA